MAQPKAYLLQGTLDLLILKALSLEPLHGYGIIQRIRQLSDELLEVEQGSLYPAVYRWLRQFREEGMPETVKALLERYPLWRYPDFQRLIQYQAPSDQQKLREEMVKLRQQGWTEKRIAQLLGCSRKTVVKWLRHARQAESQPDDWR